MGKQEHNPIIGYRGANGAGLKGGKMSDASGTFEEHGNRAGRINSDSDKGSYKVGNKMSVNK